MNKLSGIAIKTTPSTRVGIGEKRYSLAEARAAPLFHVKVEVILVGIIGLWPENGAEFMAGFIVHMLHELGLRVRGRLRSDWGR